MTHSTGLFLGAYMLALLAPGPAVAVVAVAAGLQVLSMLVRLAAATGWGRVVAERARPERAAWFSVHLAVCNEPPAMVLATLDALRRQRFPQDRFEIVVIHNNAADPALWRPLADYAARYPSITFRQVDRVEGAKAGALNIALEVTAPQATHVVTLDADYVATPDLLSCAEAALEAGRFDYVQFPQAYFRPGGNGGGLDLELADYFRTYASPAGRSGAMLLTGTLSVIDRRALESVGAWSGETTTEDAELGVRLCRAGLAGRFVDHVVGRGLMPFSFAALAGQRFRWTSGNIRTLLRHIWLMAPGAGDLGAGRRLLILSQLLAWPNAALLPTAALLASLHRRLASGELASADRLLLEQLSSVTMIFAVVAATASVVGGALRTRGNLRAAILAIAARLALMPVSARAALEGLTRSRLPFVVTPKSRSVTSPGLLGGLRDHAVLLLAAGLPLAIGPMLGGKGLGPLPLIGCLLTVCLFPAGLVAAWEVNRYRRAFEHAETGDL